MSGLIGLLGLGLVLMMFYRACSRSPHTRVDVVAVFNSKRPGLSWNRSPPTNHRGHMERPPFLSLRVVL